MKHKEHLEANGVYCVAKNREMQIEIEPQIGVGDHDLTKSTLRRVHLSNQTKGNK